MYNYDTITEALADLKTRGFLYDFNLQQNCFSCPDLKTEYEVGQLDVKETYRFEGITDPADEAVIYAIAANDGVRGTFINGYGTYADSDSEGLLQLLRK